MKLISALLGEYQPLEIFVGLPKQLSGNEGEAVEKVQAFVAELQKQTALPIIYIDERLSTVGAQRRLRESGKSVKDSRHLIDSMAAVAILESGLTRAH